MAKTIWLKNGRKEWRLLRLFGFQSLEKFATDEFILGELAYFCLYAIGETSKPVYQYELIVSSVSESIIVFSDGKSPETAAIQAHLINEKDWSFKLIIDGVETLPAPSVTTGSLNDLLDDISEDAYAVCLEGSMAGKILSIQYYGLGWFLHWEHNNERADGFLDKKFALIDNRDILILKSTKVNQIQNVKALNYELGAMMAQIADILELDEPKVEGFMTIINSVGHENLVREAFYLGFSSERANMNFLFEKSYEKFEESISRLGIEVKAATEWEQNLIAKK
jgi:hypothetical protein